MNSFRLYLIFSKNSTTILIFGTYLNNFDTDKNVLHQVHTTTNSWYLVGTKEAHAHLSDRPKDLRRSERSRHTKHEPPWWAPYLVLI